MFVIETQEIFHGNTNLAVNVYIWTDLIIRRMLYVFEGYLIKFTLYNNRGYTHKGTNESGMFILRQSLMIMSKHNNT